MSQENVEIVRRGYEAFNRGDAEAMVADIAPTFEYSATGVVLGFSDSFQGPGGWKKAVSWLREEFEDTHVEIRELVEAGELVLASLTVSGRGKQSGIDTSLDVWQIWTLEGGQVQRGQGFWTREEALEAAGLSE
jgi:ketosteroid isomerase-like protein